MNQPELDSILNAVKVLGSTAVAGYTSWKFYISRKAVDKVDAKATSILALDLNTRVHALEATSIRTEVQLTYIEAGIKSINEKLDRR